MARGLFFLLAALIPACSSGDAASAAGPAGGADGGSLADGDDGSTGIGPGDDASLADVISVQPPIDDADAPPSPDAGPGGPWIAFASNRAGEFDLYLVHPDGTGLLPLVADGGSNLFPCWSPDGAKVAFASTRGSDAGAYALYVVDVASGSITPLATGLSESTSPAWSPDGATIALRGPGGLYTVASAGGTATSLTKGGFRDNSPAWSPDGARVYFSSDRASGGGSDVWSVQPDGGALTQVTTGTNLLGGPAVSPDGATIAFAQSSGAGSGSGPSTQVVFYALAAKTSRVFTSLGDSEPAFAPSGAQLAVTSTRYAASAPSVVLLGVPGATSPFRLTSAPGVSGQASYQPRR